MDDNKEKGFIKYDNNKPAYELLDSYAINEMVKVLTYGADKYYRFNWSKCKSMTRYFGATCRHLFAWLSGEDLDPESGFHHLSHAMCCLMFMMGQHKKYGAEADDREKHI